MAHEKPKIKRIHLTFSEEQWNIIEKFRGVMGKSDAELIRNMVLAWLSEKSMISTEIKNKEKLDNE